MNNEFNNLIKQATDQIPKGGAWITLKNIQLAIKIAIDTAYEVIKLALLLTGLYYIYQITPALEPLLQQLGTK